MSVISVDRLPLEFDDRPLLAAAFSAWRGWAGARPAPAWRDVDLVQVPARLLPTTVVVDVVAGAGDGDGDGVGDGFDYVYRFWGSGMRDLYAVDETGKRLSETLQPQFLEATLAQLGEVRTSGRPAHYHVTMRQASGVGALKCNLRLPVMDRPGEVTKIITVSEIDRLQMSFGDDLRALWRPPVAEE